MTEHFIRIAYVDALRNFKRTVPRTQKKQALRTKIQALGERDASSFKKAKVDAPDIENETFNCSVCKKECE